MQQVRKGGKRFLLFFSDTGGGHRAASQAVKDELTRLYGSDADVQMIDLFKEVQCWPFYNFPRWYSGMGWLKGLPWGVAFHLTNQPALVRVLSGMIWPYVRSSFKRILSSYAPDSVVSFHGIPNPVLPQAISEFAPGTELTTVVLDLVSIHVAWMVPGFDRYFMPSQEAEDLGKRLNLPAERMEMVAGMPVRRAFLEVGQISQAEARQRLGLPLDQPLVLLTAGGDGMGPLIPVVKAVAARHPHAMLVAIVGRNERLSRKLQSLSLPVPLRVEGFVSNMELWMRAADLLVTKAGPNTLTEAFLAGLPMVIYSAILGQEEGNGDYVQRHGAGIWAPQLELTADAVEALLNDPERRRAMADQARTLADPLAAERIARRLMEGPG